MEENGSLTCISAVMAHEEKKTHFWLPVCSLTKLYQPLYCTSTSCLPSPPGYSPKHSQLASPPAFSSLQHSSTEPQPIALPPLELREHLDELLQFTKPTELFSVCGRVSLRKESQINLQIQQHEEKPGWKDNFFFVAGGI